MLPKGMLVTLPLPGQPRGNYGDVMMSLQLCPEHWGRYSPSSCIRNDWSDSRQILLPASSSVILSTIIRSSGCFGRSDQPCFPWQVTKVRITVKAFGIVPSNLAPMLVGRTTVDREPHGVPLQVLWPLWPPLSYTTGAMSFLELFYWICWVIIC